MSKENILLDSHQYYLSNSVSYLWQYVKFHWKGTSRTCWRVSEYQKVPLKLGGGLREKYSLISQNWGQSQHKMGFKREFVSGLRMIDLVFVLFLFLFLFIFFCFVLWIEDKVWHSHRSQESHAHMKWWNNIEGLRRRRCHIV